MKDKNQLIKTAIASMLAITTATAFVQSVQAEKTPKMEKCYGIVKTAMNDCQTSTQSCAGSATKDRQGDAFIFLPVGDCKRIDGGSLKPITEGTK